LIICLNSGFIFTFPYFALFVINDFNQCSFQPTGSLGTKLKSLVIDWYLQTIPLPIPALLTQLSYNHFNAFLVSQH
jgi:hypothetical protein